MTTSRLFGSRINVFNLLLKDSGGVGQLVGRGLNIRGTASGRAIAAADRAARRLLMTLSDQIKLWVINLDAESMRGVGFIRVSLTPEACRGWWKATYVKKKKRRHGFLDG